MGCAAGGAQGTLSLHLTNSCKVGQFGKGDKLLPSTIRQGQGTLVVGGMQIPCGRLIHKTSLLWMHAPTRAWRVYAPTRRFWVEQVWCGWVEQCSKRRETERAKETTVRWAKGSKRKANGMARWANRMGKRRCTKPIHLIQTWIILRNIYTASVSPFCRLLYQMAAEMNKAERTAEPAPPYSAAP